MKEVFSSVLFCLCVTASMAQAPVFQWVKDIAITGANLSQSSCESMKVDAQGNVISVGYFKGNSDFDPDPTFGVNAYLNADGVQAGFILKLDSDGDFLWAHKVGAAGGNCRVNAVALDNSGNIYCTGFFQSTVDFDPGVGTAELTPVGSADAFVLKLNADGTFGWVKQIGGSDVQFGWSIAVATTGDITLAGNFFGTADFDPSANVSNMTSLGYADIFISKLNANGDFIWAKQIGNTSFSYGFEEEIELVLDGNDNILMTGWFYDSADFDPSSGVLELTTSGGTDMFAVKLDPNGALVWAKRVGTNGSGGQVVGEGISTDATGQVYLTGRFNSVADFDPGAGLNQIPSTSNDVFVLKLSSNGDFVWVRKVLGNQDDTGKAIVTAPDGTSYITGGFEGTADFDNSLGTYNMTATGTNARDCFVLRLDTDGNFDWAFKVGSIYTELGNAIDLDASGTVHVLGFYDDPESSSYPDIDFDPGAGTFYLATSATGSRGFFLEKLSQTSPVGVSETSQSELAIVYPNPTEGNFSINVKGANTLNIYDATGKLVQTESLKSNAVGNYHLAGPSGIYFVQVIGLDGSVKSSKVVKR